MSVSDSDEFLSAEEDNSVPPPPPHGCEGFILQSNQNGVDGERILSDIMTDRGHALPVDPLHDSDGVPTSVGATEAELDTIPVESCDITSEGLVLPEKTDDIPEKKDVVQNKSTSPETDIRSVSDPDELEAVRLEVLSGKETGNSLFRKGDFTSALDSYTSALTLCPRELPSERAILLSNRATCSLRLGQDQLALSDWTHSLDTDPLYEKARLKRAQLYEQLGKLEEALEDFSEVLKSNPSCPQAREAVPRLSALVEAQREALKTEAISKLKDLGDLVLKPFGISTSDFNFVQDPSTGSYSVSFGKKS